MLLTPDCLGAFDAVIRLNGEVQDKNDITAANDGEGWLERLVRDHDGTVVVEGNAVKVERVHGRVEIELPEYARM